MDNITHTLVGAALGRAGLSRAAPLAAPALLVAANLPDIDIFGWLVGQNYLDFHRGITHGVAGCVVLSVVQAAAFHGVNLRRARGSLARPSFGGMWFACLAGILSNPALDFLNDYGIRPWLPFDSRRYYGDLLVVADPWVWMIFGSTLFVGTTSRRVRLGWFALAGLVFLTMSISRHLVFGAAWAALVVAGAAAARLMSRRGINVARISLAAFALYLAALLAVRESVAASARAAVSGLISGKIESIEVLPGRPPAPSRWMVVVDTPGRYHIADTGIRDWKANPPAFEVFEKNLDHECYRAALSQEKVAALARFARFPSATVEVSGDRCTVWLRDLRYARKNLPVWGTAQAVVTLPPPGSR